MASPSHLQTAHTVINRRRKTICPLLTNRACIFCRSLPSPSNSLLSLAPVAPQQHSLPRTRVGGHFKCLDSNSIAFHLAYWRFGHPSLSLSQLTPVIRRTRLPTIWLTSTVCPSAVSLAVSVWTVEWRPSLAWEKNSCQGH